MPEPEASVPPGGAVTEPERFAAAPADVWERLRAPFPPEQVGKLPRVWCGKCRDAPRGNACENHQMSTCKVCRNRITTGHLHLDYVGHAAVTSRLLQVDPAWAWRPASDKELATLPPINREREIWIVLTIWGVSRFGIGDDSGRGGTDGKKIMLGDALRNAGMRFGIALDLWTREDLSDKAEAEAEAADEVRRGLEGDEPPAEPSEDWKELAKGAATLEQLTEIASRCNAAGEFHGAAKAALAGKKRQLENAAKQKNKSAQPEQTQPEEK